jgi:hypothetical protein
MPVWPKTYKTLLRTNYFRNILRRALAAGLGLPWKSMMEVLAVQGIVGPPARLDYFTAFLSECSVCGQYCPNRRGR